VALDLDPRVASTAEAIASAGFQASSEVLDCACRPAVERAFAGIERRCGRVDILVSAVGRSARERMGNFADSDPEVWDMVVRLSLGSAMLCARQVVPGMRAARRTHREHLLRRLVRAHTLLLGVRGRLGGRHRLHPRPCDGVGAVRGDGERDLAGSHPHAGPGRAAAGRATAHQGDHPSRRLRHAGGRGRRRGVPCQRRWPLRNGTQPGRQRRTRHGVAGTPPVPARDAAAPCTGDGYSAAQPAGDQLRLPGWSCQMLGSSRRCVSAG